MTRPTGMTRGLAGGGHAGTYLANTDVVMIAGDGAPSDGTSGDGAGFAGPGSLYSDYTNGKLYINTNTKASPTWTVVGSQTA